MSKKHKPLTVIEKLRKKNAARKLVPPIVISRRIGRNRLNEKNEKALAILAKADTLSSKHANTLSDLAIRSMGLLSAPEAIKNMFREQGLDDIQIDSNAKALLNNAVRKISEILIFKMVANELVNDPNLRDTMVDLFLNQRFEAMGRKPETKEPHDNKKPTTPPTSKRELLETALLAAITE